jgi:hypothetical protein
MDLAVGDICEDNVLNDTPDGSSLSPQPVIIPTRRVICGDALEWLSALPSCSDDGFDGGLPGSVFTSLPDISELSVILAGFTFMERLQRYKEWFSHALDLIFSKLRVGAYAIFLQSDGRVQLGHDHVEWIDKGHLCACAADRNGAISMWHKVVLVSNPNKRSQGRPAYSHLICFRKGPPTAAYHSGLFGIPDVFDRGHMLWTKGIGLNSCLAAVSFFKCVKSVNCVVDPFCGIGTTLAMANALGFDSLGVEISPKRCTKARGLNLGTIVAEMDAGERSLMGCPKWSIIATEFELLRHANNIAMSSTSAGDGVTDAAEAVEYEVDADSDHEADAAGR